MRAHSLRASIISSPLLRRPLRLAISPPEGEAALATTTMVVLLPVYNEEAVILASLAAVAKEAAAEPSIRFTFVDDGSTDRTVDVLRTGLESLPPATAGRITLMPLGANAGKGAALRAAVLRCAPTTPVICFMDGDLAYDPSHARRLMEAMLRANAPIAIGSRRESPKELRNTRRLRRILGQGFNRVVRIGLGLPFRDTQAGVKAFTSEAAISIFSRSRLDGFAFDAELLYTAKLHNLAVVEVPARVNRAHRRKPTKVNLVSDSLRMLRDIARIRWNHLRGRYR